MELSVRTIEGWSDILGLFWEARGLQLLLIIIGHYPWRWLAGKKNWRKGKTCIIDRSPKNVARYPNHLFEGSISSNLPPQR